MHRDSRRIVIQKGHQAQRAPWLKNQTGGTGTWPVQRINKRQASTL